MQGATLAELRQLSLRSRKAHRTGVLAMLGLLLLVPLHLALASWAGGAWTSYVVVALGGAMLLAYAYVAGKERGEFRKVFARLREDRLGRKLAEGADATHRVLIPEGPPTAPAQAPLRKS